MGDPIFYAAAVVILLVIWVVLVVVWLVSTAVRRGMGGARRDAERESNVPQARGFPVGQNGPGRYTVRGVQQSSGEDASWQCRADSADNAKVKAELRGMVVTAVEYIGP